MCPKGIRIICLLPVHCFGCKRWFWTRIYSVNYLNSELEESISERDKCTLRLGPENEIHDGQCDSWLKYYVCF